MNSSTQTQTNTETTSISAPRAWGAPLIGLALIIIPQALASYFQSGKFGDSRAVILAVPLLYFGWRLWTKQGKYSPFSSEDVFVVDGKKCSKPHIVAWNLVMAFVLTVFVAIGINLVSELL